MKQTKIEIMIVDKLRNLYDEINPINDRLREIWIQKEALRKEEIELKNRRNVLSDMVSQIRGKHQPLENEKVTDQR